MGWKRCTDAVSVWEPENHVCYPEGTEMFLNSRANVKGKVDTKRKCLSDSEPDTSKSRGKGALMTKQGAAPGVPVLKGGEA